MEQREGISLYRSTVTWWRLTSVVLKALHIVLGVSATLLSLAVSAQPQMMRSMGLNFSDLAFFAAAFTAILTFLDARETGERYAAATRVLEDAIGKYDIDEEFYFYQVAQARTDGADIIRRGLVTKAVAH